MLDRLGALDVELFRIVHQGLWGTAWIYVLEAVQLAGEGIGLTALFVTAFLLAPRGRRFELVLRILGPVLAASLCSEILKRIVHAERPLILVPGFVLNHGDLPKHFSWPSGHTTAVFAFAVGVLMLRLSATLPPRRWTAATCFSFVIALVTGTARVAVGAHFPGDVLAGALVGGSVGYVAARLVDDYEVAKRLEQVKARFVKNDQAVSRH